jgi:hypothetical protein
MILTGRLSEAIRSAWDLLTASADVTARLSEAMDERHLSVSRTKCPVRNLSLPSMVIQGE